MMKSSLWLRFFQVFLTLWVLAGQFGAPVAVLAHTLVDQRIATRADRAAVFSSPSVQPLTLLELDMQVVTLLDSYVRAPEAQTAVARVQQGTTFARALYAGALARAWRYKLAARDLHADPLPILGLSAPQVNAAFTRLLGAYFALPADLSAADRARYERTFALGFQVLSTQWDRLAPPHSDAADGDTAPTGEAFDDAFLRALEDYINNPESRPADNPLANLTGSSDTAPVPAPVAGPQAAPRGEIEEGTHWSLESSDPATGQDVNWQITADPASLAAFDTAFNAAMSSPRTGSAPALASAAPHPAPHPVLPSVAQPVTSQSEAAEEITDAAHVFAPPETMSTAPASAPPSARLSRSGGVAGFVAHTITTGADGARSVYAADVDGDGDVDVLSASEIDDKISWYENNGATLPDFTAHTITTSANGAWSVYAADVDGDGDVDVLSASASDDKISWYENNGATPPGFTAHTITTATDSAESVYAADVDGDGDMDVLSASYMDDKINWYENNGATPPGFTTHTITTAPYGATAIYAADVDGDGDMDILSSSALDDTIAWYENDGATSPGFIAHTITTAADFAVSVYAADVDGDGDMDVLSASYNDNKIAWYENDGATLPGFTAHTIATPVYDANTVYATDVDSDGDIDVLSASRTGNKIAWYENDGATPPDFTAHTITTAADDASSVYATDVDGDGDVDVLSASYNDDKIAWYENRTIHYSANFPSRATITTSAYQAHSVYAADIDSDGDIDALSASWSDDKIAWYENDGATPPNFTAHTITTDADGANAVYATDVDGDGDMDILSSSWNDNKVAWYENNGNQNFTERIITIAADTPKSVYAADMDRDGDMDVLSANDDRIAWYENDGNQNFTMRAITTAFTDGKAVHAADIDGDGDMDAVAAFYNQNIIAWYENDGSQAFTAHIIVDFYTVDAYRPTSVYAADVDSDGDMDVLSSSQYDDKIAWYENDGNQTFIAHTITTAADGAQSVYAVDVDGDGDMDVLSGSGFNDDKVAWYENDGSQSFTEHVITTLAIMPSSVYAADVDRDGDMDVLSASSADHSISWYENTGGQYRLATTVTAPVTVENARIEDIFRVDLTHLGRGGDSDIELATLGLRFTDLLDTPFSSAEVDAFLDNLHVYRDTGSGDFEVSADTLVASLNTFSLSDGYQTFPLPDGAAAVRVSAGESQSFFVVLELADDANAHGAHNLRVTHVTSGTNGTRIEESAFDTSLEPESAQGTSTDLFLLPYWSLTFGNPGLSDGDVNTVVISGTTIYAGGSFTGKAAQWNGSAWSTLSSLDGDVHALVISGTTLYAGGAFTGKLARWTGSAWETVGGGLNDTVYALAADATGLYAGGDFIGAGGVAGADRVARWDGSAWHALGSGANNTVRAIALDGTDVYMGGSFTNATYPYIARWDGAIWQTLSGAAFSDVYALSFLGSDLYAGDVYGTLERWDGSTWHTVGGGLKGPILSVNALATNGSDLYVGGVFTGAGGIPTPNIARWNGVHWSALNWGTGGAVNALDVGQSGPVVGGTFTVVDGDVASNKIAAWEPPLTDLTLSHTVNPTATAAGDTLTYTLTLSNSSALTATSVTLRDTLPDGLTLQGQSDTCTAAGQEVTCTLSSLAPSAMQAFTVTAATAIADAVYVNTAFVSAEQPESNGLDNHAGAPPVTVTVESDLALGVAGPLSVVAGRELTYTLVVTNHGPNSAPNTILTDELPAGITFLAATPGCIETTDAVTCPLSTLAVDETATYTLTAAVPSGFGAGTFTNTATVASEALDPVSDNHTAQVTTSVTVEADLAVALSAPSLVCISGTLYTTLVVTNAGPSQAESVTLSHPLPTGATFATASPACTHNGGTPATVTCAAGDLPLAASRTYTVAVTLSGLADTAIITHSVTASAASPDPISANNTTAITTTVRTQCSGMQADLSVAKTGPATVAAGAWVTYTLTARNHGSLGATGVSISDTLPAEVSFNAAASDPACTDAGHIVCTVGTLAAGQFRAYTLVGRVAVNTPASTMLTNTAAVDGNEADFLPVNNQDHAASTVVLESDLALSKTAPLSAATGMPLVYTLTVTNIGPSHAAGVVLTDTLPAEVVFDAVSTNQGLCTEAGGVVACDLGALNAGLSTTVRITVTPFQNGGVLNTASVVATTSDPAPDNDTASASVVVSGGRETRVYDYLRVTANAFIALGGGEVQALGDIWLGAEGGEAEDPIALTGETASLTINTADASASGSGQVWLRDGEQPLFNGTFTVTGTLTEPLLIPGDALSYAFDALADFKIDAGLAVTDTNLSTGGTRGHAMLAVQSQALSKTLQTDFEILPGPEVIGTLADFEFTLASMTVTVNAPQLGNTGIGADEVVLTLPERLGHASATVTGLKITPESLTFGQIGATFPLPDIKFGDGNKVKIVDTEAALIYMRDTDVFALTASGTLSLTLPSNEQAIVTKLRVDTAGNLSANLDQLSLTVAGSTLQMQDILINNSGLAVAAAVLTLPPSFKGATATLSDIAITGDGLSIGGVGAVIPLPDLKVGSGDKVKFTELQATLEISDPTGDPDYTFGIAGILALRLPQNSQDIAFTAQIDGDGNFSGTLDQLSLTMAGGKATLKLETIAFNNSGLAVETGTLSLSLGSTPVTGVVMNLRIDDSGISVGGGSVTVEIPDIKVGSGKNFSLTDATVTLELGSDRSYKLTLAGTMAITIPGADASATARISVDGDGHITGSVQAFSLTVAGLGLAIENARLEDGMLYVDKAAFEIPPAWGGLKAELYHLRVGGASGLRIGGGKFTLPDIKVGKITLAGLEGGFVPVDGGYEITAAGLFKVPGLGGGPNCGIKVGVTLFAESGRTVMAIHTLESPAPFAGRPPGLAQQRAYFQPAGPQLQPSLSSLALKDVTCGLEGCRIPIGATGFFLERVDGALTLDAGTTHIDLGVTIVTGFGLGTIPAVAGDADVGIDFDPFELDFTGAVTLFSMFKAAELNATMRSGFFSADLVINQIWPPFRGEAGLTAWTTDDSFHLVGHASLTIGFKKGQLWHKCIDTWVFGTVCGNLPPWDLSLGGIYTEFGEFYSGSGTTWGLKGWVDVADIPGLGEILKFFSVPSRLGVYFDTNGKISVGDVEDYRTITPPSVARALALRQGGIARAAPEDRVLRDAYRFEGASTYVTFTVPAPTNLIFYLVRVGDVPTMTLIQPDGSVITPDTLPANVGYGTFTTTEVVTETEPYTRTDMNIVYAVEQATPGIWRVKLDGATADGAYIASVFGFATPPTLSGLSAANIGDTTAEVGWSLSAPSPTTTLNLYVTPGPISTTFTLTNAQGAPEVVTQPLFSGYPISINVPTLLDGTLQTQTLDLSGLESGTYYVWFDANDDRNPPVRAYAPTTITVTQSWTDAWAANLQVTPGFRDLALTWNRSAHPDVDGYTLYVTTDPIPPTAGDALDMGDILSSTLTGLTPNQTYYLTVGAVDEDTGRIALSESITATPQTAPFAMTASTTDFALTGGDTAAFNVQVTTPLADYPGVVGLRGLDTPDGITLLVAEDWVTPTQTGITVGVTLSTTARLPGGTYTATLAGTSMGDTVLLPITLAVQEPSFTLSAPTAVTLTEGASTTLAFSAASVYGEQDVIHLSLDGVPPGLLTTWSQRTLSPGEHVSLYITDTALLKHGTYTLILSGEDGETAAATSIVVHVIKPGFSLRSAQSRRVALYGETVTYTLEVAGHQWPYPVRLTLDEADPVPGSVLGFRAASGTLSDTLTVTVPAQVFLVTQVTSATLAGQYLPTVVATSADKQATLDLDLMVYAAATTADLGVSLSGSPVVTAGTGYVYTATVTNYGPLAATGVRFTATLPSAGVSGATASADAGTCALAGNLITCTLADLARDAQADVQVNLVIDPAVAAGTQLAQQVRVSTAQTEDNLSNNAAAMLARVRTQAALALHAVATPDPVTLGHALTYHVTLTNTGPSDAAGVQLLTQLPSHTVFNAASAGCTHVMGSVTCDVGRVPLGSVRMVTVTAEVQVETLDALHCEVSASAINDYHTPQVTLEIPTVDQAIAGLGASANGRTRLGNATAFSATVGGGTHVAYMWDFGDGSPTREGAQLFHTYANVGRYPVTVTATNTGNAISTTLAAVVYADYTWTGSESTEWTDARNWLPTTGQSPTSADNVTLPARVAGNAWPVVAGDLQVRDLHLEDGAELTLLDGAHLYVEGTFSNQGMLRQTVQSLAPGSPTRFLHLQNAAGTVAHYFGVDVEPTAPMGPVTVAVKGHATCTQVTGKTVQRCFDVTAEGSATLTFYYEESERSDLAAADMLVWHWHDAVAQWEPAGSGVVTRDTQGPLYAVMVANVDTYSPFVLRPGNTAPAADADTFTVPKNGIAVTLDVLAGDTDSDGDTLHIYNVGPSSRGSTLSNAKTHLRYTPASGMLGTDTFTYTVSDGFSGFATAQVTVMVTGAPANVYLPLITRDYRTPVIAPDLVVTSITATPDGIQVTLTNQGNAPVQTAAEFFVQVYLAPDPAPTAVNQLWYDLCDRGMFWSVTADLLPLAPGASLTLTSEDAHYMPAYSRVTWPLAVGTPVYAQVDAYNESTTYGLVYETHEILQEAYNNITGPVTVTDSPARAVPQDTPDFVPTPMHLPTLPKP